MGRAGRTTAPYANPVSIYRKVSLWPVRYYPTGLITKADDRRGLRDSLASKGLAEKAADVVRHTLYVHRAIYGPGRNKGNTPLADAFARYVADRQARTRNARPAAIHSLFRYTALRHPEHAANIQRVLAIPAKRSRRALVSFLSDDAVTAQLAALDRTTTIGRRDHALLLLALQTGLWVPELVRLRRGDVVVGAGSHVRCTGKGRKERVTSLSKMTAAVLNEFVSENNDGASEPLSGSAPLRITSIHTGEASRPGPHGGHATPARGQRHHDDCSVAGSRID